MQTDPPARHVLAVNDDPEILKVYAELLADEGYLVSVDRVPATDLADVHAADPDLIVLDLIMGGQELGTTFLALLRSDPSTRDLPVLVCSGDTPRLKELSGQLRAWGCDVLTKPFDIDVFVDAVRAGLGNGITTPGG